MDRNLFAILPPLAMLFLAAVGVPAYAACAAGNPNANMIESTPTSDFTINGDGTVTHAKTGLMWKQCAEGLSGAACATGTPTMVNWANALNAANTANAATFAGYTDWRLPNYKELESIVEYCGHGPAINQTVFPATPSAPLAVQAFWSSTSYAPAPSLAHGVDFYSSGYSPVGIKTTDTRHVRLVRAGDSFDLLAKGTLKVCKVAGPGVTTDTISTFTYSSNAGSGSVPPVPAGPAPGGTCVLGPSLPSGTNVTVTETNIPLVNFVSSITVAPSAQIVGSANTGAGTVTVAIGTGVTEVTFSDQVRTGYLEICKQVAPSGLPRPLPPSTFTVPGNPGSIVVPVGACSPAIQVFAGPVVIQENPSFFTAMVSCSTMPASQQGPCNTIARTSTVTVAPGDVSVETIAIIINVSRLRRPERHQGRR